MNKTDKKIILELQKNGRVSYSELAIKLRLNKLTVARRINYLLKSNIISIRALPNPYALDLVAHALIAIKADPLKIDKIYEKLSDNFNIFVPDSFWKI
jgi:DNA-binding Lrp family transcriptional regulator